MIAEFETAARTLGYSVVGTAVTGELSTVFPGRDDQSGRRVALKVLDPEHDEDRLLHEAKILAKLRHPAIARFRKLVDYQGTKVLVTDWVEGDTLAHHMRARRPFDSAEVVDWLGQIAGALDTVHAAGIVHRNISPANLMIENGPDGGRRVRIIDFGVSRSKDKGVTSDEDADVAARYHSPETLTGGAPSPQADQYSLAVLAQELLSGSWPFAEVDAPDGSKRHHLHTAPTPIREVAPNLPVPMEKALLRALSKHPNDRFETMSGFVEAMRTVERSAPRSKRSLSLPMAASAVVLGALIGGLAYWALLPEGDAVRQASEANEVISEVAAEQEARDVADEQETELVEDPELATDPSASTIAESVDSESIPTSVETASPRDDGVERFELPVWESGLVESFECNLFTEADFEGPVLPVNFYADPANPQRERVVAGAGVGGSGALEIGDPNVFGIYGELVTVEPNTSYLFTVNARVEGDVSASLMWVDWMNDDFEVLSESAAFDLLAGPAGQHGLITEASPPEAAYGVPRIFKGDGPGLLFVDELLFTSSEADCVADLLG